MKKVIYDGSDGGIYSPGAFRRFLNEQEDAELINTPDKFGDTEYIFVFDSQNVTLKYRCSSSRSAGADWDAKVTLFGPEKGLGNVEKRILKAAVEF